MRVHDVAQNSPEWLELRLGKPTASSFSQMITSTGEPSKSISGYALTLAGELYAGKSLDPFEGNKHTERGHELESEAISLYSFANLDGDMEVERVGFVTDNDNQYGCSPDGFIGMGLIEIKCLKAENHIKAILYYQKHNRCQSTYVAQTQGQMWICARQWTDLVFYHPYLPLLVIRQKADEEFQAALEEGIAKVIQERDNILAAIRKQAG